ncbi:MAG: insulinase family protein, partial [Bacteroidaceae bacterium]|nr:insulinase family protein [Bacteroidaceae bacterium]
TEYHRYDMLSDILANGRSARLFRELVMNKKIFSEVNAYITGDIDAGLFFVTGKPNSGISLQEADKAICLEMRKLSEEEISEYEVRKIVNKFESNDLFSNINYLNKATNLAYHELLDKAENINTEAEKYREVTPSMLRETASRAFVENNCSTLYYHSKHCK